MKKRVVVIKTLALTVWYFGLGSLLMAELQEHMWYESVVNTPLFKFRKYVNWESCS